jgi:hypothetical protein
MADVPTGSTGDLVLTVPGTYNARGISAGGLASATSTTTGYVATDPLNLDLSIPAL